MLAHMSQDALVKMKSTKSAHVYYTRRNKKSKGVQNKEKLELKKFDPTIRERVVYKQIKK
jgi:ribosomal protein L33